MNRDDIIEALAEEFGLWVASGFKESLPLANALVEHYLSHMALYDRMDSRSLPVLTLDLEAKRCAVTELLGGSDE